MPLPIPRLRLLSSVSRRGHKTMLFSPAGWTLLIVLVVFGGCSSSETVTTKYQEGRDRMVYETEPMRLSKMKISSSYSTPPRFYAIVRGTCEGRACSPDTYQMRIVADSDYKFRLGSRELRIFVDRNEFRYPSPSRDEQDRTVRVRGVITDVTLTLDQLRQIGRSKEVSGALGSISFELPKRNREPIVDLLIRTMRVPDDLSGTGSSR